jgi:hypothetical protein
VVIESMLNQLTKDKDLEQIFLESVSREEESELQREISLAS